MKTSQDYINQLFDLTRSATKARGEMDSAVSTGRAQQYHKALRQHPEVLYIGALQSSRRHIGTLLAGKRHVAASNLHPDLKAVRSKELDNTIRHVAEGTTRWVLGKLGGGGSEPPQGP